MTTYTRCEPDEQDGRVRRTEASVHTTHRRSGVLPQGVEEGCAWWLENDHNFDHNWAKHIDIMGVRVSPETPGNQYLSVTNCLWILCSRMFRKQQVEGSNPPAGSSKV